MQHGGTIMGACDSEGERVQAPSVCVDACARRVGALACLNGTGHRVDGAPNAIRCVAYGGGCAGKGCGPCALVVRAAPFHACSDLVVRLTSRGVLKHDSPCALLI